MFLRATENAVAVTCGPQAYSCTPLTKIIDTRRLSHKLSYATISNLVAVE